MHRINLDSRQIEEMFAYQEDQPSRSEDIRSEALRVLAEIHDNDPVAAIIIIMQHRKIPTVIELARICMIAPNDVKNSVSRTVESSGYIYQFAKSYLPVGHKADKDLCNQLLEMLAKIYTAKPSALRVILDRIIYPNTSQREAVQRLNISKPTIMKATGWIYENHPELRPIVGCCTARARAQRARHARGAASKTPGVTYDRREKCWIARKRINGKNIRIAKGYTESECLKNREFALKSVA